MSVRRLTVQNYRNIASADIVPDAGVTVFAGDNADVYKRQAYTLYTV